MTAKCASCGAEASDSHCGACQGSRQARTRQVPSPLTFRDVPTDIVVTLNITEHKNGFAVGKAFDPRSRRRRDSPAAGWRARDGGARQPRAARRSRCCRAGQGGREPGRVSQPSRAAPPMPWLVLQELPPVLPVRVRVSAWRPGTRRRPGRAPGDRDRPRRRRSDPVAAIRIHWPGPAGAVRVRATGRPGFPRSRCGRTGDGADAAPRSGCGARAATGPADSSAPVPRPWTRLFSPCCTSGDAWPVCRTRVPTSQPPHAVETQHTSYPGMASG